MNDTVVINSMLILFGAVLIVSTISNCIMAKKFRMSINDNIVLGIIYGFILIIVAVIVNTGVLK